jgi:lipopolysaccharide heptosyltransferase II
MTNSSRSKKTIFYVSGFADIAGGGQRSFFLLAKNLDLARFRMVVLCPAPGEVSREVLRLGVEVRFLGIPPLRTWKLWRIPAYIIKFRGIAARSGADLIHCDTLDTALLAGLAFCGLPLVFHARASDTGSILDQVVPFFCDRIICVSKAVTARFTGVAGLFARLQVIYNGVNTEEFSPAISGAALRNEYGIAPEVPLLGYCGQLVEEKGLKVLVEAFEIINREFPESRLILAGRGAFKAELQRLVRGLKLEDRVIFTGFIENIPEFMAALDVFVLPSFVKEGLARVLLEAMACGKPVISSTSGGNAETVLDGVTGYFFAAGSQQELARKALALLKNRGLAKNMGEAGRARAEQDFSISRTVLGIHKLYNELLQGGGVPPVKFPDREKIKAAVKEIYLAVRKILLRAIGPLIRGRAVSPAGFIPKKILLIRVDRLGDMTLSTPVFKALKDKYPDAELHVLAAPAAGALISADPHVDKVISWGGSLARRLRTITELRRGRYDAAIDPLNGYELKPALLAFFSGGGIRLGYAAYGREVFFNVTSAPPPGRVHFSQEAPYLLRLLGIPEILIKPELFASAEAAAAAEKILKEAGFLKEDFIVAIHPGGVYSSKRWNLDRFAEVAAGLVRRYSAKLLLIASGDEQQLVDQLSAGLPGKGISLKAVDLRPDILCALMRGSRLFIGNNSGPLHMAAALGIPGVSTMGPADPVKWPPLGENQVVLRSNLPCSPCNRGNCKNHECMKDITVEMMMKSVETLLAGKDAEKKEQTDEN